MRYLISSGTSVKISEGEKTPRDMILEKDYTFTDRMLLGGPGSIRGEELLWSHVPLGFIEMVQSFLEQNYWVFFMVWNLRLSRERVVYFLFTEVVTPLS